MEAATLYRPHVKPDPQEPHHVRAHSPPSSSASHRARDDLPNFPGTLEVTVSLQKVSYGTELSITQASIPEAIPLDMCYLGWQESLAQLATLVEPEIPE